MERNILTILHGREDPPTSSPTPEDAPLDGAQFDLARLAQFAMWNSSSWALDSIARRLTRGEHDWEDLRAALIGADSGRSVAEGTGVRLSVDELFVLWDALGAGRDPEAESAVLGAIVHAHGRGESLDTARAARLVAGLLVFDRDDEARTIVTLLDPASWIHAVAKIELAHPRFGGSFEASLGRLNLLFREAGLATLALRNGDGSPFSRLESSPDHPLRGPLVTIVMSAWRPGAEIFTAVRSVVSQSYQDWELVVTDDASGEEFDDVFEAIAALDERIRIVRNTDNAGTYVRRNEILREASGEFVTFHDSDDWSHPQRIETQVRDLLNHPDRIGNVVRHVRVTEDLSFATNRGMSLTMAEPSIMFRRAVALEAAGFYDSLRKGADREYRLRLETITGSIVKTVGPAAPLQLMLASTTSLSGSDFAPGWMTPARVAYRSASDRYHSLIREGRTPGRMEFPQARRALVAPAEFLGSEPETVVADVVVIADLREAAGRAPFLAELERDLRAAAKKGLSLAVLHSDSIGGRFGGPRLAKTIQALVDEGVVRQILEDTPAEAGLVVVRHAIAAQGHRAHPRPIRTDRVIVVEDAGGGDRPGKTFSRAEAGTAIDAWFGTPSVWVAAGAVTAERSPDGPRGQGITILASNANPSSRLRYEHQAVSFDGHDVTTRFRRVGGSLGDADVVFGVGSLDALLPIRSGASPQDRLRQTQKFVDELSTRGAGLVRTVFGEDDALSDALDREARDLLDAATTRFIVIDDVTSTPDPMRTVRIPFANPIALFAGYPVSERVAGRLLCLTGSGPHTAAIAAVSASFVARTEGLTVRVTGVADAALEGALQRAARPPFSSITSRVGILSDAALIEEITAAEFVLIPELRSLPDYQLAMMALAFDRPVLTPANDTARALSIDVGAEWVVPLEGTMSAECLDRAITRVRDAPERSRPRLHDREWTSVGERYEQVFRNVVREQRERRHAASLPRLSSVARLDYAGA